MLKYRKCLNEFYNDFKVGITREATCNFLEYLAYVGPRTVDQEDVAWAIGKLVQLGYYDKKMKEVK